MKRKGLCTVLSAPMLWLLCVPWIAFALPVQVTTGAVPQWVTPHQANLQTATPPIIADGEFYLLHEQQTRPD